MNIDLRDPDTWAKLERQAYDGTVELRSLPAPAYKYFSELAAIYYAFRFEGMPKEDAERAKRLLLKAYQQETADLHSAREIFAEYQENAKKSELCRTEIEKAEDAVTIAARACEIIEALTGETGFAERQKRKLSGWNNTLSDKGAHNEYDMLHGNLNRMFVTHDPDELVKMYTFAVRRLEMIRRYHAARLEAAEVENRRDMNAGS